MYNCILRYTIIYWVSTVKYFIAILIVMLSVCADLTQLSILQKVNLGIAPRSKSEFKAFKRFRDNGIREEFLNENWIKAIDELMEIYKKDPNNTDYRIVREYIGSSPLTTEDYNKYKWLFDKFIADESIDEDFRKDAKSLLDEYKKSHPTSLSIKRDKHVDRNTAKLNKISMMNKHSPVLRYNFRASTIEKIFASNNLLQLSVKRSLSKNLKKKHH